MIILYQCPCLIYAGLVIFQIQGQAFNNDGGGEEERPNGFSGGYGGDTMVIQMESMDDGLSGFLMQVSTADCSTHAVLGKVPKLKYNSFSLIKQVEDIRELLREFKEDVELVKQKHSEILSSPNTDDRKDLAKI